MGEEVRTLSGDLIGLGLVVVLILLNAFFVAAEFALVSVRKTRIEEMVAQKKAGAAAVKKAIHDPDRFIAATQLGITLASLALGWVGEPALSHIIDPVVALIPIPAQMANLTAHGLAAALAFGVITFLHVVLGELTPKSVALQRPELTSLFVAQPLIWVEWLFKPAVWALNGAGNFVVGLFGLRPASGHELVHSVEEIKMLAAASADQGVLEESEYDMLDSIFDLRRMMVRQLMIPRTDMVILPAEATLRDAVKLQKSNPHGKFPVYEKDADHIIGALYVRDMIEELAKGNLKIGIRPHVREAIYLPDTTRINSALRTFRDQRQRMAIVLDEYGGTAGMLTLEDILEEIAGDLPDQFDADEAPEIRQKQENVWEVNGMTLIKEVNDALDLSLSDENYDTIGGYVMGKLERIPQKGDEVRVDHLHFRVEKVDGMRIDQVRIKVNRDKG